MRPLQHAVLIASFLATSGAGSVSAQTVSASSDASPVSTVADLPFGAAPAIGETDLGKVVGREDTGAMIASATQRNTVSNNSVVGRSTTGAVQIDGNAFQNLQGLAVISANSGNNVAINAAMNVTVNITSK